MIFVRKRERNAVVMNWGLAIIDAVIAYLLGSISFSIMLTTFKYHSDVRTQGSGNAGATNVARVFGMKAGLFTLLGDMAKTAAAMGIGAALGGDIGLTVAGIACIIGHCFPIYYHFRGGKGVSVGAMIGLMIDWRVLLLIVGAFAIAVALTRIVSIASMTAAVALPLSALLLHASVPKLILAIFTGVLVIFMHRGNIVRLIHHQEGKFKPKKKDTD